MLGVVSKELTAMPACVLPHRRPSSARRSLVLGLLSLASLSVSPAVQAQASQSDASSTQSDASSTQSDASSTQSDASSTQADASSSHADVSSSRVENSERATARSIKPIDVLIVGGTVHDGSGGRGYRADVAIRGDRIVAIGELDSLRGRGDQGHRCARHDRLPRLHRSAQPLGSSDPARRERDRISVT